MLNINKKLVLDGIEYDGYQIEIMEINFQTNAISIKVSYFNRAKHLKLVKDYPIKVGDEINLLDAVNQIHEIHNNIIIQ